MYIRFTAWHNVARWKQHHLFTFFGDNQRTVVLARKFSASWTYLWRFRLLLGFSVVLESGPSALSWPIFPLVAKAEKGLASSEPWTEIMEFATVRLLLLVRVSDSQML